MKFNQKVLVNELIRLNVLVDPSASRAKIIRRLNKLLNDAQEQLIEIKDVREKIQHLLNLFYGKWEFNCDSERYFFASNLLLEQVLIFREGMPVSLGAILLFLAEGLRLPIYPVDFPTQLLLRVEIGRDVQFIDPWDGKYVSEETLQLWLEGAFGFGARLKREDLQVADIFQLTERLGQVLKNALIRDGEDLAALQVIKDRLLKDPENPYDIRDRGMVLANLDCLQAAMADFDYFIQNCPEDPSALLLGFELDKLRDIAKTSDYIIH